MHIHSSHPDVVKRLKRANGHLTKIVSMVEEARPCVEVAQQLQAVYSAIGKAKELFVRDHIEGCITVDENNSKATRQKMAELKEITKSL